MKRICVFCGSRSGDREAYVESARATARALGDRGLALVYGGGRVGLMGALADEAIALGIEVTGVIPDPLMARELGHERLTRLEVVPSMHARKARMAELADAFLALPGGLGTLEELSEMLTWGTLGIHAKPVGLLDVLGYYRPLVEFLSRAQSEGFVSMEQREFLLMDSDPGGLLDAFSRFTSPRVKAWLTPVAS